MPEKKIFQPFVSPETNMKELAVKSILQGSLFGVIFGAATIKLALKAGLTVSASIPIALIAIQSPSWMQKWNVYQKISRQNLLIKRTILII